MIDEFEPVTWKRPRGAKWFHELADEQATAAWPDGPAVAWPGSGRGESIRPLLIPRQRGPHNAP